ncbi:MAG: hypothetical protein H6Q31_2918, partial [Bacteroidetes bacterium]|nr:hypothetical protein [Bacteroidota bacterium]
GDGAARIIRAIMADGMVDGMTDITPVRITAMADPAMLVVTEAVMVPRARSVQPARPGLCEAAADLHTPRSPAVRTQAVRRHLCRPVVSLPAHGQRIPIVEEPLWGTVPPGVLGDVRAACAGKLRGQLLVPKAARVQPGQVNAILPRRQAVEAAPGAVRAITVVAGHPAHRQDRVAAVAAAAAAVAAALHPIPVIVAETGADSQKRKP